MPTQDSIRTEIKYKLIESIDTVFITLPPQTVERTSPDTTSTLENDYAKTTATILPNGLLFHNLETKQTPVPVPAKKTEEQRDSIVYQGKEVPVPYPVEVEVNRLTWAQQAQIYGFRVLVALPKGTNTDKPEIKNNGGDDALLWACNKWLLAHPESNEAKSGAHIGLTGKNIDISEN